MKNQYLLALAMALVLLSCSHKSPGDKMDAVSIQKQDKASNEQVKKANILADTTKKIAGYTTEHSFSDPNYKDIFSINLYGKSVLNGVVVFEIFDHTHKSIFKETFVSQDLLGDEIDDLAEKQKLDTISVRMKTFFDENQFHVPAIDAEESFDMAYSNPDNVDKAEWEEMKKDRSAIGFYYNYGYEGTYGIAYNKKRRHVFMVFYSD